MKLFLVNGSPTGVITAEIGNWSGKAVVAPRTALPELIRRVEAARCGVYILMGADPDNPTSMLVYVGEGDSVLKRLQAHDDDDDKQFFTRVCIIVSKDENLTKAHGRYLEARIMELIREAGRAVLVNGTNPTSKGLLPEAERADMERFLSEIKVASPRSWFRHPAPHSGEWRCQCRIRCSRTHLYLYRGRYEGARNRGRRRVCGAGQIRRSGERDRINTRGREGPALPVNKWRGLGKN